MEVTESKQEIDSANFEVRKTLNRLVRRPGKNFTELFEKLKTLKGDVEVQVSVLQLVIKESLRFKRQYLAGLLEEHIQTLLGGENKWLILAAGDWDQNYIILYIYTYAHSGVRGRTSIIFINID